MKKQITCIILALLCCSCNKKEKLIIAGSGWSQIAIIDKTSGDIEWKHDLSRGEECNKVEATPNGDILYSYKQGAKLIDRNRRVIWDFKVNEGEETHYASCSNGNYVLGICGSPARIVELDGTGKPIKEIKFDTEISSVHGQFRHIRKTPQNTYLIPLMGSAKVVEINNAGSIIRSVSCGGTPFSVKLIENGNWLVSCGESHTLSEINPQTGETVKKVEGELTGCSLLFVAEAIRYKNGNTLISNWNGHSADKSQPLLLEINPSNEVVWKLPLHPNIKNISAVYSFKE